MKIYRGKIIITDPYEGADTTLLEVFALKRGRILREMKKYMVENLEITYEKEETIKKVMSELKVQDYSGFKITDSIEWNLDIDKVEVL